MNPVSAANAGPTGTHEHPKGTHVVGKDPKGNRFQFDTLLQQVAFPQTASQHGTSRQPALSHRVPGQPQPVTLSEHPCSRGAGGEATAPDLASCVAGRAPEEVTRGPAQDADPDPGHAAHVGNGTAVPAGPSSSVTALRAPVASGVVSEATPRRAAGRFATAGRGRGRTSREVHAPVDAVPGQGGAAAPRPAGAGLPASALPASRAQHPAHGSVAETHDPVSLGGARSRAPVQRGEGARAAARPAARPLSAAGSNPAAGPNPASGPNPQEGSSLPGVAGQLVRVLSTPQPLPDGSTTVTVALDPPSLGVVKATVVAGADRLSVQLVTTTAAGAEALRLALGDLKSVLSTSGQQVQVTVSDGSSSTSGGLSSAPQGGGGRQSPSTSPHHPPASPSPPPPPPHSVPTARRTTALRRATPASSSHLVDIRI